MKPVRPAALISTIDPEIGGGVGGVTKALSQGLRRLGYSVEWVFVTNRVEKNCAIEEFDGVKGTGYRYIPFYNSYLSYLLPSLTIRKYPGEFQIYFAVGGGNHTAMPYWLAGRKYHLWISNTLDDEYEKIFPEEIKRGRYYAVLLKLFRPFTRAVEKAILRKAEAVFVESRYSLELIKRSYHIDEGKLVYLPYPMEPAERSNAPASIQGKYILFVGRIDVTRKNVQMLVRAFAKTPVDGVKLVLAGKALPGSSIRRLVDELGLADRVVITGFVDEETLRNLYTHARVFVMPSLQEGLGNAIIEALSFGLPVVATRCGGAEDSVMDGRNGYLVDVNDVEGMADRLHKVCADDELRERFSEGALRHIREVHSWERFTAILREHIGVAS